MKCLSLENIAFAVNGKLYNKKFDQGQEVDGVVIDSRKVEKNYLFVAIKGERVDGHDYVKQVFEKHASCVLVEKEMKEIIRHPYIVVNSTLQAIKDLAEFYRRNLNIKVVGITGSVGKTSTKEFIGSVLSEKYKVLKTAGNFNNEIGLPLTIFNIDRDHEIAVLEMGISDFGEMSRLTRIARPDICVITNIGLCHLENLGSRDGVLKAKTEMFRYANEHYNVVLNGDDDKLITVNPINENDIYFYGINQKKDIYAKEVKLLGIEGSECIIVTPLGEMPITINIPGKHMIYNAMAATVVGMILKMDLKQIKVGIEKLQSIGGRLNIIKSNGITIIDDCYNANPVSVKSSLDVLEYGRGRKIAILGDMFELGEEEKKLHYEVGNYLSSKNIDGAICIGTLSENTYYGIKDSNYKGKIYYFDTIQKFIDSKNKIISSGDTILVKASHSMHFENIVQSLK